MSKGIMAKFISEIWSLSKIVKNINGLSLTHCPVLFNSDKLIIKKVELINPLLHLYIRLFLLTF